MDGLNGQRRLVKCDTTGLRYAFTEGISLCQWAGDQNTASL